MNPSEKNADLRELDLRIAGHLGWFGFQREPKIVTEKNGRGDWIGTKPDRTDAYVPYFSTDIAEALELLKNSDYNLWKVSVSDRNRKRPDNPHGLERDSFWASIQKPGVSLNAAPSVKATADSMPLAICRAFEAAFLAPSASKQSNPVDTTQGQL